MFVPIHERFLSGLDITIEQMALAAEDESLMRSLAEKIKRQAVKPFKADCDLVKIMPQDRFFGPTDIVRHMDFPMPEEVSLPMPLAEFENFMNSPCPVFPIRRRWETSYLCYMPVGITVMDLWRAFPSTGQPRFRPFWDEDEEIWFKNDCVINGQPARKNWILFLDYARYLPGHTFQEQLNMCGKFKPQFPLPVEAVFFNFAKTLKSGEWPWMGFSGRTDVYCQKSGQRYCVGDCSPEGIVVTVKDNFYRGRDLGLHIVDFLPEMEA